MKTFTIPLTQGKEALVDEYDFYSLRNHKWRALWAPNTQSYYAARNVRLKSGKRITQQMARVILGLEYGDPRQGDHIDHDTLDNRRDNLRIVSPRENHENRRDQSRFGTGVQRDRNRFRAHARVGDRKHYIGMFDTPEEALTARARFLKGLS